MRRTKVGYIPVTGPVAKNIGVRFLVFLRRIVMRAEADQHVCLVDVRS